MFDRKPVMRYTIRWLQSLVIIAVMTIAAALPAPSMYKAQAGHPRTPASLPPYATAVPLTPLRQTLIRASALYDTPKVVRIQLTAPNAVEQLLTQGIDVLELPDIQHNRHHIFAIVSAAEQRMLLDQGWHIQLDHEQTALFDRWTIQSYLEDYQTVEEIQSLLYSMAQSYPTLARVEDFGDSWERVHYGAGRGYDLLALRMTSTRHAGEKPVFLLLGAVHAREMVSAEIATRFITMLLEGYGTDATITWLLDEHEIVVAPMANPDGRKLAEQGYFQRKNTNDQFGGGCATPPTMANHTGVDLNRNFGYQWGSIFGPSIDPCNQTYPGGTAASEPETQAIQQFATALFPNHPSPGYSGVAAPDTTSGVVISLHSYAEMVLWPWGYTDTPPPNAAGLAQLGQRMAAMNGYYAGQAVTLYPTSGTTDDWAYATLGVPMYTFEIGPSTGTCAGFMPPASCLDTAEGGGFWQRNRPALLYAARVARTPYILPKGPEVRELRVISDTMSFTVTAMGDNDSVGGQVGNIALALGMSPWYGSTSLPLTPTDGLWDSPVETAQIVVPIAHIYAAGLDPSTTLLLVQGQDQASVGGAMHAAWLHEQNPTGVIVQSITSQQSGDNIRLLVDLVSSEKPVQGGAVYLGGAVWDNAKQVALTPVDGAFDSREEQGEILVSLDELRATAGYDAEREQIVVTTRGYDSANAWGLSTGSTVAVPQQQAASFVVLLPVVIETSP